MPTPSTQHAREPAIGASLIHCVVVVVIRRHWSRITTRSLQSMRANRHYAWVPDARPADADLVEGDLDAWLVLIGVGTFLIGFLMALAVGLEHDGSWMPPPAWLPCAAGAGALQIATARATKRLRPGISRFEKWKFQSWLGQQWTRPAVLAQSWRIVRGRRS